MTGRAGCRGFRGSIVSVCLQAVTFASISVLVWLGGHLAGALQQSGHNAKGYARDDRDRGADDPIPRSGRIQPCQKHQCETEVAAGH
jgi:hypothetical protein